MQATDEGSAGAAALDCERLRALALVLVAAAPRGMRRTELARQLLPLTAHRLPGAAAAALIEPETAALVRAGLLRAARAQLTASAAGKSQAALFLGRGSDEGLPSGDRLVSELVAKALGVAREPKRLKALATREGLHLAIVQHAYRVKVRGTPTPARLRMGLAAIALARAFGNQLAVGALGLSARAGRTLAGQLAAKPREHGTDQRLISALAAEHLAVGRTHAPGGAKGGARKAAAEVAALRLRVLQRYLDAAACSGAPLPQADDDAFRDRRRREPAARAMRPDLCGFASEVRAHAQRSAQGWAGDRKAFISHVWRLLSTQRPEWGLSEIEFKCMLAEAHRAGQVLLANADLKDTSNLRDVQESALVYKNAVFHFVRVDV
jgi:hypothetical protein